MKISLTQFLKHSTVTLLGLGLATGPANAISITTTDNGNTLVNTILGQGITASNVTYSGGAVASGTFSDGLSSGIGIDSGIILTTGSANLAVGPNNASSAGISNGAPEDTNLNSLLPPGGSTQDASILEFDFVTTGGDIFFNYVFASEEYNEFANSTFNDVFGFFLDGTNIALIPGTTTPVSINTVNGGNPVQGTGPQNPQFFRNNSDGTPSFNTQYDGFTTPFTAQAIGIGAGTHRLKLAVADVGDSIFDTAVFIQGSSVAAVPVDPGVPVEPVPEPSSILGTLVFGAFGTGLVLKGKQKRKQTQQA